MSSAGKKLVVPVKCSAGRGRPKCVLIPYSRIMVKVSLSELPNLSSEEDPEVRVPVEEEQIVTECDAVEEPELDTTEHVTLDDAGVTAETAPVVTDDKESS